MSERLTEGDLQALIINASHMGQTAKHIAFEAVAEIRERRAADLSDADREALRELDDWCDIANVWDQWNENNQEQASAARALLSRLVEGGKR